MKKNKVLTLTNGEHIIEIIQEGYDSLWLQGETGYFPLNINSLKEILDDKFIVIGNIEDE